MTSLTYLSCLFSQKKDSDDDKIAQPSATDDLLAALAAMGFEISECESALQQRNVTLEEAVEMYVNICHLK